ncbi:MAG: TolC family protein [Candidatus Thiodiazotropha sp. L084R]
MATYELDLFGRISNLKTEALEQYLASVQGRRALEIILISDIANAYITLTADTRRLKLARDTLANQLEAYQTWQFIPSLTLPIFNAGRNRANLEISETDQKIALAEYELSIQRVFREVADSLAEIAYTSDQLDAQRSLAAATNSSYELAKLRYAQGIDGYLQVLDAQRSNYLAQQNLVQYELGKISAELKIYKALGGKES